MKLSSRSFLTLLILSALASPAAIGLQMEEPTGSSDLLDEARALYPDKTLQIRGADDDAFTRAFPGYELYVVSEMHLHPPIRHALARNPSTGAVYDLTTQWNSLMNDAATLLTSREKALAVAEAYAQTGMVELQLTREVVDASDSVRLSRTVQNSSVSAAGTGWQARITTWAEENGVLSTWTINLTLAGVSSARWDIDELGVGPFGATLEAISFRPGMRITSDHATTPHEVTAYANASNGNIQLGLAQNLLNDPCYPVTEAENFDGSTWRVCYRGGDSPPAPVAAVGSALGQGGVSAYSKMVSGNPNCSNVTNPTPNFGFAPTDTDCTIGISLLAPSDLGLAVSITTPHCGTTRPACVESGEIYIDPYYREFLLALYAYVDPIEHTAADLAESVVGHEYFHILQLDILGTFPGEMATFFEGQARFVETVLDPQTLQDPTSLFYHPGPTLASGPAGSAGLGVQQFQLTPAVGFCKGGVYRTALVFGHAHTAAGGEIGFHKDLVEGLAQSAGLCEERVAQAFNLAYGIGGPTFGTALEDVAWRMHHKRFEWVGSDGATHQWGGESLVSPKTSQAMSDTLEYVEIGVGAWGRVFVQMPSEGSFSLECLGATARLYTEGSADAVVVPCDEPPTLSDFSAVGEATLVLMNNQASDRNVQYRITSV